MGIPHARAEHEAGGDAAFNQAKQEAVDEDAGIAGAGWRADNYDSP